MSVLLKPMIEHLVPSMGFVVRHARSFRAEPIRERGFRAGYPPFFFPLP